MLQEVTKGPENSAKLTDDKTERSVVDHPEVGNSAGPLTEVSVFTKSYEFEIPEFDYDLQTFPTSYSDYVTVSDGSSLTFSLSMNAGTLPSELWIHPTTGIITLRNDASNTNSYNGLIITVTTDSQVSLQISGISVNKVCGLTSTTLTPSTTHNTNGYYSF